MRACLVQRLISYALLKGFFSLVIFFFVIAIAKSFGNNVCQTKACRRVETNNTKTIADDMKERVIARPLLGIEGTSSAYLMVATEAVVIGKV